MLQAVLLFVETLDISLELLLNPKEVAFVLVKHLELFVLHLPKLLLFLGKYVFQLLNVYLCFLKLVSQNPGFILRLTALICGLDKLSCDLSILGSLLVQLLLSFLEIMSELLKSGIVLLLKFLGLVLQLLRMLLASVIHNVSDLLL